MGHMLCDRILPDGKYARGTCSIAYIISKLFLFENKAKQLTPETARLTLPESSCLPLSTTVLEDP